MTGLSLAKNPLALIIEDNEAVVEIFKAAIERAGFEVELIADGRAALERLAIITPAFILLDLHLPHVSGDQIVDYIHTQERLANTYVVLASADLLRATSLEDKVNRVMIKPFGFTQLYDLARQVYQAKLLIDQKQ
jgi:CheY-like chemotaxis protein